LIGRWLPLLPCFEARTGSVGVKFLGAPRKERYTSKVERRFLFLLGCALVGAPLLVHADERPAVTFMGFQTFPDQTSRIFVHMTKEPALQVEKQPNRLVFALKETGIFVRNNKNPLNLEHFATPAKRANLVEAGPDVHFVVELKREVETQHRFSGNTDGTVTLQVDFPSPATRN
jgi:hypothetical protein